MPGERSHRASSRRAQLPPITTLACRPSQVPSAVPRPRLVATNTAPPIALGRGCRNRSAATDPWHGARDLACVWRVRSARRQRLSRIESLIGPVS